MNNENKIITTTEKQVWETPSIIDLDLDNTAGKYFYTKSEGPTKSGTFSGGTS